MTCILLYFSISLFQGMGFSLHERQVLGIHGLLPPCYRDQEKQMQLIRHNVDKFTEPINKYTYLMGVLVSFWVLRSSAKCQLVPK